MGEFGGGDWLTENASGVGSRNRAVILVSHLFQPYMDVSRAMLSGARTWMMLMPFRCFFGSTGFWDHDTPSNGDSVVSSTLSCLSMLHRP